MIRRFSELFKRIKNWPVQPVATTTAQQPNGGIPAHLQAPSWLPRRRSGGDGWTALSPEEMATKSGISSRRPTRNGFEQQTDEQDRARTAQFREGEQI
jgi:hypothetical protein